MKQKSAVSPTKFGTILKLPGAAAFTFAGIPARMHLQGAALAMTLLIVAQTGSYTIAGLLVAVFTVSRGVSGPWLSRIVDRRGQFAVMSIATLTQSLFTVLLALGAMWSWNMWILAVFAALAGLSSGAPPAFIRARWVGIVKTRPDLDAAFAWEALVESFGVAITPLILVAIVGFTSPTFGLIFLAAIGVIGGCALYLQRGTEPPITRTTDGSRVPIPRSTAIRIIIFTVYYFCAAIAMGAMNIIAVEQGDSSSIPGYTGIVLAAFAIGTMVGATLYGSITWRSGPADRLRIIIPCFAISTLTLPFLDGSMLLLGAAFIMGLPFIAILTSTNRAVQEAAPQGRLTELLAWLATALGVGVAVGNLAGGVLIDLGGYVLCSMLLIAAGVLGLVTLAIQLLMASKIPVPSEEEVASVPAE